MLIDGTADDADDDSADAPTVEPRRLEGVN
jgi:hypothetical protein